MRVSRDMSLSIDEFFRLLPRALPGWTCARTGLAVDARRGRERICVTVETRDSRNLGPLSLPAIRVDVNMPDVPDDAAGHILARFDLAYQRGGG